MPKWGVLRARSGIRRHGSPPWRIGPRGQHGRCWFTGQTPGWERRASSLHRVVIIRPMGQLLRLPRSGLDRLRFAGVNCLRRFPATGQAQTVNASQSPSDYGTNNEATDIDLHPRLSAQCSDSSTVGHQGRGVLWRRGRRLATCRAASRLPAERYRASGRCRSRAVAPTPACGLKGRLRRLRELRELVRTA